MTNDNFMKQYSTTKSKEEFEIEASMKMSIISKKVCDYWKNRIFSQTTLVLTDKERADIQEVFQELETEIKANPILDDYAMINDFDIIRRINKRINSEYLERDIMSHIDNLTGSEIDMYFSQDYI